MADIENPWHSRPVDVHRWSDHPEVAGLCERVWEGYLQELTGVSGPKPKTAFRHQLRVLMLDLYVAWLEDPELSIGVSMSSNYWDTSSRYNAIHISKKIIPIIHALVEADLLDIARGSYSGPYVRGNRTTRIRASETLQEWFAEARFSREDIGRVQGEEILILRDTADGLVEYEDTDQTIRMRTELERYNEVIGATFIDVPVLDEPIVDGVSTDHHHKLTRRIFSRSDWSLNGRFHGGWWQQVNSDWRSRIFINDTPVVEVDFRGLHVSLLSLESGKELTGDPYELEERIFAGVHPGLQRTFIKRLTLTAINANSKDAAFRAFRDGFPTGHFGKSVTNDQLERLLAAFLEVHPHLKDRLFTDQGIRLMNLDSQITERVHRYFMDQAVPVLSVHDSYLIDYTRVAELKQVMADASRAVAGAALPTSNQFYGLDEQDDPKAEHVLDYVAWRQTARSEGYLKRLAEHEARTSVEVVPFAV